MLGLRAIGSIWPSATAASGSEKREGGDTGNAGDFAAALGGAGERGDAAAAAGLPTSGPSPNRPERSRGPPADVPTTPETAAGVKTGQQQRRTVGEASTSGSGGGDRHAHTSSPRGPRADTLWTIALLGLGGPARGISIADAGSDGAVPAGAETGVTSGAGLSAGAAQRSAAQAATADAGVIAPPIDGGPQSRARDADVAAPGGFQNSLSDAAAERAGAADAGIAIAGSAMEGSAAPSGVRTLSFAGNRTTDPGLAAVTAPAAGHISAAISAAAIPPALAAAGLHSDDRGASRSGGDAGSAIAAAASPAEAGGAITTASGASPGSASGAETAEIGIAGLTDRVANRIVGTLAAGRLEVVLRLHPPELGELNVRMQLDGHNVTAWFESPQPQVQQALTQGMAQLQTQLASAGYTLNDAWVGANARDPRDSGASAGPRPGRTVAAASAAAAPDGAAPRMSASLVSLYV